MSLSRIEARDENRLEAKNAKIFTKNWTSSADRKAQSKVLNSETNCVLTIVANGLQGIIVEMFTFFSKADNLSTTFEILNFEVWKVDWAAQFRFNKA